MTVSHPPTRLQTYMQEGRLEAAGLPHWPENTKMLAYFDARQREKGITGCVGEIGVAGGAFFVPLALCCRDSEVAVAIDVFDQLDQNWNVAGGDSSLEKFKGIIRGIIGNDKSVRYIKGNSLYLHADRIKAAVGGTGFRLFSIDGAHSDYHTANDLRLAGDIMNPGGIVILDDIGNWGWPGVLSGFARYMLLSDVRRVVPFLLFGNKAFLCTVDYHEFFLEKAVELAESHGRVANQTYRVSEFFGHQVIGW